MGGSENESKMSGVPKRSEREWQIQLVTIPAYNVRDTVEPQVVLKPRGGNLAITELVSGCRNECAEGSRRGELFAIPP